MIAIYRGEDTDFAGAEPIQIRLDTELNLDGFTAQIKFGDVVKVFPPEEVATKMLGLSYTAEESSTFFPGLGYATVKVFDTKGRVAYLKRFLVDVRFRSNRVTKIDIAEAVNVLANIKEEAKVLPMLTEANSTKDIKSAINGLLAAVRERTEFKPLTPRDLIGVSYADAKKFVESMNRLEEMSLNLENLDEDSNAADVKKIINAIISVIKK